MNRVLNSKLIFLSLSKQVYMGEQAMPEKRNNDQLNFFAILFPSSINLAPYSIFFNYFSFSKLIVSNADNPFISAP